MTPPNVLFIVWDACRADAVSEHAPAFMDLANNNLLFERAYASSTWSLPSHASLFTGMPPHEHGITTTDQRYHDLHLLETLGDEGYHRYGVSANGFVSESFGVDEYFDEFQYTLHRMRPDALDARQLSQTLPSAEGVPARIQKLLAIFRAAFTHNNTVDSIRNVARLVYNDTLFGRFDRLADRHPLFAPTRHYQYRPQWNTEHMVQYLTEHADREVPFFLFANYMDTHHPYFPEKEYQWRSLGRSLSYRQIYRLNETVGNPLSFLEQYETDSVDEEDLETLKMLYNGTVSNVDDHLSLVLEYLEATGLINETLVIVTADHGENLGDVDGFGRRRMGHLDSVSEALLGVPLVVAHPDLDAKRVTEPVSLTSIPRLVESFSTGASISSDRVVDELVPDDKMVVVERPADFGEDRWTGFSEIPQEVTDRESFRHTVVGYLSDWKLVLDSEGESAAWLDGTERDPHSAPDALRQQVTEALNSLCEIAPLKRGDRQTSSLDSDVAEELKNLGYL